MYQSKNILNFAVVDLQGFQINKNEFVLKELCFSFPNINKIHHYIFAPPCNWTDISDSDKKGALFLKTFHHGFFWKHGSIPYHEIYQYIKPLLNPNLVIYVKGHQKIQWLHDICKDSTIDVRNIEELCSINLVQEAYELSNEYHCGFHRVVKHCAKQNVKIIANWLKYHLN